MNDLPPIGARVTVAPVNTVSAYLHGQTGEVVEHKWSYTSGPMGAKVAVVFFDTPVERHWSPMPLESIALRADQLQELRCEH